MLSKKLLRKVLLEPANDAKIDRLLIVSGYAGEGMADLHMRMLERWNKCIDIELIIGMTPKDGIAKAQHHALQKLVRDCPYNMKFSCWYVTIGKPVHAKTYCWLAGNQPKIAFIGSANYSLTAFKGRQIEVMTGEDCDEVFDFHNSIRQLATDCTATDIEDRVSLKETPQIKPRQPKTPQVKPQVKPGVKLKDTKGETVYLSLLQKSTGKPHKTAGINWGHRKGRNKNQAYIPIPSTIYKTDFFPERGVLFTAHADDKEILIMTRAQDGGKALHTTQSNALLGEYLRKRMGLPSGEFVTLEHLLKYGRTDVSFTKIDDETYLMDFSPR